MQSRPKVTTTIKRTRTKSKKAKPQTAKGTDWSVVKTPRGGYAHAARDYTLHPPTAEELAEVNLRGVYGHKQTPELVMYGRRMHVRTLMVQGESTPMIVDYCRNQFQMSETQTKHIIYALRQAWRADLDEQIAHARSEAIVRLRRDLSSMRAGASTAKDWAAIARHENILAKIEGTYAPVKVAVHDINEVRRSALNAIMGNMTDEEMESILAEGFEVGKAPQLPAGV